MKQYFRTVQSVLDSRWGNFQYTGTPAAQKTDRVLQSSKLEDCIYRDLSTDDENLEAIQQESTPKLHSFPALSRDIFQSFYSLFPKRTDADRLTAEAQKFNAKLLDHVTEDTDYPTIKSICEGRELPAYEAASEFTAKIGAQLDGLLSELGGKDGTLKTLEKLQAALESGTAEARGAFGANAGFCAESYAGAGGDRRGKSGREQNAAG